LTKHAQALFNIASEPEIRIRDLAKALTITERRAFDIVNDLVEGGYITKSKVGRRNRYAIQANRSILDLSGDRQVLGELVARYIRPADS
jgi:predicted transcriptional regulator